MLLLTAINHMLVNVGQAPVNSTDVADPDVALAKTHINRVVDSVLWMRHQFNTDEMDLTPNNAGKVTIPTNALQVIFPNPYTQKYTLRKDTSGNGPYVWDLENNDWVSETIENCLVVLSMDFEDLPFNVADYVMKEATVAFYKAVLNATDGPYIELRREAQQAKVHFRNTQAERASLLDITGAKSARHAYRNERYSYYALWNY